jgi:hypothetical protein
MEVVAGVLKGLKALHEKQVLGCFYILLIWHACILIWHVSSSSYDMHASSKASRRYTRENTCFSLSLSLSLSPSISFSLTTLSHTHAHTRTHTHSLSLSFSLSLSLSRTHTHAHTHTDRAPRPEAGQRDSLSRDRTRQNHRPGVWKYSEKLLYSATLYSTRTTTLDWENLCQTSEVLLMCCALMCC